ncbi:MAG TPA: hypothetical protein VK890_07105 [Bacteroidia bacterium]|nr:hypothetical protein [Bacteroidia bacterium]
MNDITPFVVIDFPATPAVGDIFTAPSGAQYQWDGTVWTNFGGGGGAPPGGNFLPLAGGTLTGDLLVTNPPEGAGTSVNVRNRTGNPELVFTTGGGAAANIIFNYGAPTWGFSVEQNLFHIYHQTAPGNSVDTFIINNDNSITITGPLSLTDRTGSSYLELVGSAQNSIAFRGSGPASGAPQWVIDVITGQSPAMNGFHLARLSPDGLTVIDDVFNILNSDGIIRAGTIRTKSGDPVDPNDLARKAYVDANAGTGGVTQAYVDAADALRVLKSGDTITGALEIDVPGGAGLAISGPDESAILLYNLPGTQPMWEIANSFSGTGGMTIGFNITRLAPVGTPQDTPFAIDNNSIITVSTIRTKSGDPVNPNDLARKAYVDSLIGGGGGLTIGPWTNPTSYGPGCTGTLQARLIGDSTNGFIQLKGYVTNTTDMEPPNTFVIATLPFGIPTQRFLLAPCGNGAAFPGFAITIGLDTFSQLTAYNATQQTTPMTRVWLDGVMFTSGA